MDEDAGAKAPVTRLRRRLSVESDDVKSPSGPSTPTKKRGGTLAAKPQLDLIAEIATENIPKRSTRKTAVKDSIEPAEEKAVTPSRRSARIRSNTSIVSETTQSFDSPRAKRAARRTSQVGSDSETPLTPAAQTRRTRKDSTSSIDKQVYTITANKTAQLTEVIIEETGANSVISEETDANNVEKNETPVRKSPRLLQKKDKPAISATLDAESNDHDIKVDKEMDVPTNNMTSKTDEIIQSTELSTKLSPKDVDVKKDITTELKNIEQDNMSSDNSSDRLIIDLDRKPKKIYSFINKSTSAVEESNSFKSKRQRTKSWSTICVTNLKDDNFCSDNEGSKRKRKDKSLNFNMGSGDGVLNTSGKMIKNKSETEGKENDVSLNSSKKNNSDKSSTASTDKSITKSGKRNKSSKEVPEAVIISTENNEENIQSSQISQDSISVTKLFEKAPSDNMQSLVFIEEDSDSNTGSIDKVKQGKHFDGEDQCVPVVEHQIRNDENDKIKSNDTCEPMDVDETMPQSITITDVLDKNTSNKLEDTVPKRSSTVYLPLENENLNDSFNKSTRKYSVSYSESQNLEKSGNEKKTTLILSQVKDTSSNEINVVSKVSKVNSNEQSQSTNIPDIEKDKERDKKNLSSNYLTSTPLQQKANKKIGMQIDTSIISPKNSSKKDSTEPRNTLSNKKHTTLDESESSDNENLGNSLKEKSNVKEMEEAESSTTNESEDETSKERNKLIDDEAEEASVDYESGDSQDEDERQYEKDNEILENGETLETEDDDSDDTDYEKDSFIVSSDEEDKELLSGSGDDLSMSDNELTMSAKSKKKFDDRRVKEQKRASREMYQARHKINDSDKSSKSNKLNTKKNNRQRLDSSSLNSEDEVPVQPKKKNRLRIDSSQDISVGKSEADDSVSKNKKKSKRLSESVCEENVIHEKEITICNETIKEKDDPLLVHVKQEPKTPQKHLNISAVLINDDVEEVQLDNNVSMMKSNITSDPLQATMATDDDSSSGNEEIMQNYDAILNELKTNSNPVKSRDISLNLDKKKKKVNAPIVDQLNLTQTNKTKKKCTQNSNESTNKLKILQRKSENIQELDKATPNSDDDDDDDDAASDSIDMRLLFPEDSNESEVNDKHQNRENTVSPVEEFIPLKKAEAQTNIRASMDTTSEQKDESLLNISKKKSKKRESCQHSQEEITATDDQENVSFFIDTTGTQLELEAPTNTSLTTSAKKKKNKRNSTITDDVNDTPIEVIFCSTKEKYNTANAAEIDANKSEETLNAVETSLEITSEKKKKRNKKSKQSLNDTVTELETKTEEIDSDEAPVEIPYHCDKKTKKKLSMDNSENNATLQMSTTAEPLNAVETSLEITSEKKKKGNKKSKQSLNDTVTELEKKTVINEEIDSDEAPVEIPYHSDKKTKKKLSMDNSENNATLQTSTTASDDAPLELSSCSNNKKKKKLSESRAVEDIEFDHHFLISQDTSLGSAKNRKQKLSSNTTENNTLQNINDDNAVQEHEDMGMNPKKRKRKSANSSNEVLTEGNVNTTLNTSQTLNESSAGSQKKKRKISGNHEVIASQEQAPTVEKSPKMNIVEEIVVKKSKKNKLVENEEHLQTTDHEPAKKKRNKKRKERDDDDTAKISKVLKENSLDKIHVPRLPSHILNELDDKPKKVTFEKKKPKAISTTNFLVEETRVKRSKPSNYLEESVYLNDSPAVKKQKGSLKKPKVLPFIPTASTSDSGFTTNFRINLLPHATQFTAQSNDMMSFKNDCLQQHKLKRFHTFEKYKNTRNSKISKF